MYARTLKYHNKYQYHTKKTMTVWKPFKNFCIWCQFDCSTFFNSMVGRSRLAFFLLLMLFYILTYSLLVLTTARDLEVLALFFFQIAVTLQLLSDGTDVYFLKQK